MQLAGFCVVFEWVFIFLTQHKLNREGVPFPIVACCTAELCRIGCFDALNHPILNLLFDQATRLPPSGTAFGKAPLSMYF